MSQTEAQGLPKAAPDRCTVIVNRDFEAAIQSLKYQLQAAGILKTLKRRKDHPTTKGRKRAKAKNFRYKKQKAKARRRS